MPSAARTALCLLALLALVSARPALAEDDRQKLVEENLSLKVKNTALETEVLGLQDRLNRMAAERDRLLTESDRVLATLGEIQKKLNEAAARMAELEQDHQAARAAAELAEAELREQLAAEQAKAQALAQELAATQAKANEVAEAREAEIKALQAKLVPTPSPKPVPPPAPPQASQPTQPNQGFLGALSAAAAAFRADKDPAAAKAALLRNVGTMLSEVDFEKHLNALVERNAVSSWTKYGSEEAGLSYLIVTKAADNRFVGLMNLSFADLLNGKPGALSDIEAIDRFYPIEIRSTENWDQTRVSWLYEDGANIGALPPDFAPSKTPWAISDYLRARTDGTTIFAAGGRRDAVRPLSLADLEKKEPERFVRLAGAAGQPRLNAIMHMNSITLDPAVLTRGLDFKEFEGLRAGVEAAFAASLARAPRKKGIADAIYGRLAALILMPEFALETVAALGSNAVRLTASYLDASGHRQSATVDFRKEGNDDGWAPAAVTRDAVPTAARTR